MGKRENRTDEYIRKSAPFAQVILKHIRQLVHATCSQVEEKIKWGFPHFDYLNQPMMHMAAFKQHCAVGFWKAGLMDNAAELTGMAKTETAMGHLGKLTALSDLPSDAVLKRLIKNAMKLNELGAKLPPRKKTETKSIVIPMYFARALQANKKALKNFEDFSPGNKKEYLSWITEAKSESTRNRRMETAIEWISEGKIRNWKYLKK